MNRPLRARDEGPICDDVPPAFPRMRRAILALLVGALGACSFVPKVADGTTFRSADGRQVAVVQKGQVAVNGQPAAATFDGVLESGVTFCAAGNRVAYGAVRGDKFEFVVDGKVYGPFEGLDREGVKFSPLCKHVTVALTAGGKWRLWMDGEIGPAYDGILKGPPVYSPDDDRMAYGALKGERWVVVSNGREIDTGGSILKSGLGFVASGQLYLASIADKQMWVRLGDTGGEPFNGLYGGRVRTSPDGQHLVYGISRSDALFHCIDLDCRPQAIDYFGSGLREDEGFFGASFWKSALIGGVIGGVAGPSAGAAVSFAPGSRWAFYISTVFSPDGRHHANVGTVKSTAKIMLDDVEVASLPEKVRVEYLSFSARSDVLLYRPSSGGATVAMPLPGSSPFVAAADPGAPSLAITAKQGHVLVYVDERFVGIAPQTFRVAAGSHRVELQRRGFVSQILPVAAQAGQVQPLDVELERVPVRKVVETVLDPARNRSLLQPVDKVNDDLMKARILLDIPHDDELLAALKVSGDDAVLFSETGIHVTTSSRRARTTRNASSCPMRTLPRRCRRPNTWRSRYRSPARPWPMYPGWRFTRSACSHCWRSCGLPCRRHAEAARGPRAAGSLRAVAHGLRQPQHDLREQRHRQQQHQQHHDERPALFHHRADRDAGQRLGDEQQHAERRVVQPDHHVQHHQHAEVHEVDAQRLDRRQQHRHEHQQQHRDIEKAAQHEEQQIHQQQERDTRQVQGVHPLRHRLRYTLGGEGVVQHERAGQDQRDHRTRPGRLEHHAEQLLPAQRAVDHGGQDQGCKAATAAASVGVNAPE